MDEVRQLLHSKKPPILSLVETHVTSEILQQELEVEGYKLENCLSTSRHTGGIAIYIREDIKYKICANYNIGTNIWVIDIRISASAKNHIFLKVLYHSPSASHSDFLKYFNEWIDELVDHKSRTIILGDFNIDISKSSYYSNKLKSIINSSGMRQLVKTPTRVTHNSKTIIDLVLTNDYSKVELVDNKEGQNISDHEMIFIKIELKVYHKKELKGDQIINKRKRISEYDVDRLNDILGETEWQMDSDVNRAAGEFVDNLVSAIDKVMPLQRVKVSNKRIINPWFNNKVLHMQRLKINSYIKAKATNSCEDWLAYTNNRNNLVKSIRIEKRSYYDNRVAEVRNDPKEMWKVIKNIMGNNNVNSSKKCTNITFNGKCSQNPADSFNQYFVNSVNEIVDSIELPQKRDPTLVLQSQDNVICASNEPKLESFRELTIGELKQIIRQQKNKKATDEGISTEIMKKTFATYGQALLNAINQSLSKGIFPEAWKVSTIIPIQKVQNTKKGEEYRPINMLPIYEKIIEKVVYKQLKDFVDINSVLCENQSGFRAKHSCETALQMLLTNWKEELDTNKIIVSVFLDFKRAFETIDRQILIQKLEMYGVTGNVLQWFKSYLSNRLQFTKYNDKISDKIENQHGVPQGSVIGPLLFIIYINDINKCMDNVLINLFADDTLISLAGYNLDEICMEINIQLAKLSQWLKLNKLQLNVIKTKCMILTSTQTVKDKVVENCTNNSYIIIDGEMPEFVKQFKYLGVIIDEHLKFTNHVNYIAKKISKKIGVLSRISPFVSPWVKILIYKTIIGPHFDYCSSLLWDIRKLDISLLQKLQNRGMRIVLGCNRYTRITDMLQLLQWTSVQQRIALNTLVIIFKINKGLMPSYLDKTCKVKDVHQYKTRSENKLYLKGVNKSSTQKALFYSGIRLYNKLNENIRNINSVGKFRKECVSFVKTEFKL
jgi:Reverse transcriptase (RNA-dependent DNA polymerase)/Endonuclease-reverse transcriptase